MGKELERLRHEIDNERAFGFQYWPIFLDGAHAGGCRLKPKREGVPRLRAYRRGRNGRCNTSTTATRPATMMSNAARNCT